MKYRIATIAVALLVLIVLGLQLAFGAPATRPADHSTVFTVREHRSGRIAAEGLASSDNAVFGELLEYVNDPKSRNGFVSITTYVPSLVIESDVMRLNFLRDTVVVSTRASKGDGWRQYSRSMSAEDARIAMRVREWLHSKASEHGGD